jgi:hypothetical protein
MIYERDPWPVEVLSAASRLLNAIVNGPAPRGDGAVTFSASCFAAAQRGCRVSTWLIRRIDGILGPHHCRDAWVWHRDRGLVPSMETPR